MKKVYSDAKSALAGVLKDGMLICAGGFGLCGIPETLILAIRDSGVKNLTIVVEQRGCRRRRPWLAAGDTAGQENDLVLCGRKQAVRAAVFGERTRDRIQPARHAGRAHSRRRRRHPRILYPTGAGTDIAEGKEEREFDGDRYIMERGIVADLSVVHAWMGDREGNLVYRKTARNFNPMMATAGKVTVAEVEHLVEPGESIPITSLRRASMSSASFTSQCGQAHRATHRAQARAAATGEEV